eukprot:scaffold342780_cov81-Attheya_sp.AAC.1
MHTGTGIMTHNNNDTVRRVPVQAFHPSAWTLWVWTSRIDPSLGPDTTAAAAAAASAAPWPFPFSLFRSSSQKHAAADLCRAQHDHSLYYLSSLESVCYAEEEDVIVSSGPSCNDNASLTVAGMPLACSAEESKPHREPYGIAWWRDLEWGNAGCVLRLAAYFVKRHHGLVVCTMYLVPVAPDWGWNQTIITDIFNIIVSGAREFLLIFFTQRGKCPEEAEKKGSNMI